MTEKQQCKDCKFYDQALCRRFPPKLMQFSPQKVCMYPEVYSNGWCGEFKPVEKQKLPEQYK